MRFWLPALVCRNSTVYPTSFVRDYSQNSILTNHDVIKEKQIKLLERHKAVRLCLSLRSTCLSRPFFSKFSRLKDEMKVIYSLASVSSGIGDYSEPFSNPSFLLSWLSPQSRRQQVRVAFVYIKRRVHPMFFWDY